MTRRRCSLLATPLFLSLLALSGCEADVDPPEPTSLSDELAVLNAQTVLARTMRDSEMGHEAHDDTLSGDPMGEAARRWLDRFDDVQSFASAGRLHPERANGEPEGTPRLADYADAAYIYHMHHSGGRFEEHGLLDEITHSPTAFLTQNGEALLADHYREGSFQGGGEAWADMAFGLDAFHALAYAWVRWSKPGGAEDMGRLDADDLALWMGYELEELVGKARRSAEVLDGAWDASAGAYDMGSGSRWDLAELASLLRGHKGLYELLYLFGDDGDREHAERLFNRAADLAAALLHDDLLRPWGLPETVQFEDGRAVAASDVVNGEAQWRLVHHLTGGFALLRENDGTARYIERTRPDLAQTVGRGIDTLLLGGLEHHFGDDGDLAATLDYESGEALSFDSGPRTRSAFIMAAGNGYLAGEAFGTPDRWSDDEELAQRSRALYDAITSLGTGF